MITKSLKIGDIIYDKCKDLFDNRCYPVMCDKGTQSPYMTYRRSGLYMTDSKDKNMIDNVVVEIGVFSDDYNTGVDLIQQVKDRLELNRTVLNNISIIQTEVTGCAENWHNDLYIQSLILMFKVCSR